MQIFTFPTKFQLAARHLLVSPTQFSSPKRHEPTPRANQAFDEKYECLDCMPVIGYITKDNCLCTSFGGEKE